MFGGDKVPRTDVGSATPRVGAGPYMADRRGRAITVRLLFASSLSLIFIAGMENNIWIPATIGALSALCVTLIKDFALPRINAKYSRQRTEDELFEDYLNPIVVSLEALMWRLDEILNQKGRGVYLRKEGSGSQYADYKRISTVYRICVAIGWFRAFERELLSIRPINRKSRDELRSAMRKFQSALADGKSLEIEKYDRLVELFGWGGRLIVTVGI